ncbi:MAG: efflux RND transporter permease subunit [Actinomycetota bacterium]
MMRWIIGSSLKARGFMLFAAALMIVMGVVQLRSVPKDVLPEFTPPTVEVQTEALGLSANEVEELITVPLEQDLLNGVAFLHTIRSASLPGLSSIEMVFEPGTDILDARQVVEERLTQAHALPQVSKPPQMLQPVSSTSRVMMVGLTSDELSLIDMSLLARWNIRPRLMGVPGVANVSVWGQRDSQLQVLVDPARLHANGVSLQQIIETSANAQFVSNLTFVEASTPGTGGIIETPNQRFGIQHGVPFASPADLAKVIVQDTGGAPLRLGDVADIVVNHQPLIGDAVFADGPGLLLVIEKLPGANPLDVTRDVEAALDDLRPGLSGITIDTSLYRPGTYIESSSGNLTTALIIGAVLLLLALGAFLFAWRTALIAVVAMATSMLTAVLVLTWTHTTFNSMIVAGLILALVVVIDDAVGDAENVARRMRARRADGNGGSGLPALIVRGAFLEMRSAGLYALLISLVVFVPVFFTRGAFGAFFPSIAVSYAVAVVASMMVALLVTPALGLTLLAKAPTEVRESPIVGWLRPRYERGVTRVLGSARPVFVLAGVVLLVGLLAVPFLGRSFTPEFKDTDLLVRLSGPPGTSLTEMDRVTALMSGEIRTVPGVLNVDGHAGRALLSDQVVGTEASELWVTIDPDADYDATRASIDEVVRGYPGLNRDVVTYPSARIDQVLGGTNDPITVRIFGQDLGILRAKAEEVQQVLAGIDGIEDPRIAAQSEEPTLEIEVDLDAAERYGIVPGDVRRAAATLLSGIQVGSLFDDQKVFDVVVWGTPEVRHDLSSVENLEIDTPAGKQVRLGDVADVRIGSTPTVIRHVDVSRSIDVTASTSGRDLGAVTDDVQAGLGQVEFPMEYHAALVGDYATGRAADRQALGFAIAAALALLLLVQAAIGNWRLAALVFLMLPLSLSGGAVAALIDGRTVSIGSVAGFLAIFGLAARQAVMQIRHAQHLERHEGQAFGEGLVLRGAGERFAPVLTSVVTTALVFAPLALAGRIAGLEIVQPMAVVVLGGLVSTTLLTLFVVPALYQRFGARSEPDLSMVFAEQTIDLTDVESTELTSS